MEQFLAVEFPSELCTAEGLASAALGTLNSMFLDVFCLWEISKCQPLFLLKVFNDIAS